MHLIPLTISHIEEAAQIFCAAYQRQRQDTPILDEQHSQVNVVMEKLAKILEQYPGVAVFEKGSMIGYMAGMYFDRVLGVHKFVISPEWAHSSTIENSFEIYRRMYQSIGQQWMEAGCLTHAVNFLQYAQEARNAFCWNGFGYICIDAIRPMVSLDVQKLSNITIRPATESDIPGWKELKDDLSLHLSHSPAFLPHLEKEMPEDLRMWLKSTDNHAWIATKDDLAIGFIQVSPYSDGAALVVNGEKKMAITDAFVKPEYRDGKLAKALVNTIMQWGIDRGLARCSVDFEATNIEASHFWPKYFQPVCTSMIRRLDERIKLNI
jgi:GNAT superfamily N-acetyltransferase